MPRVLSTAFVVRGSSRPAPAYTWHCCVEQSRNGSVRLRRPIFWSSSVRAAIACASSAAGGESGYISAGTMPASSLSSGTAFATSSEPS